MLTWVERRWWKLIPTSLFAQVAYFPDKVIVGFTSEPRLQHSTDAEPLTLPCEEPPRALQLKPELHKAFLGILNLNHSGSKFFTFHYSLFTSLYLTPKLLLIRFRLAIPAAHFIVDNVSATLPTAQSSITTASLTLLLTHLVELLFGELIGQ